MRAPTRWPGAIAAALLLAACGGDVASPTLDDAGLRAEVEAVGDPSGDPTADGPSEEPSVTESSGGDDGGATASDVPSADASEGGTAPDGASTPTSAEAAATCTLTDEDAGIQVLSPTAGASVDAVFTVTGCGNTFEAAYVYEVVLDEGGVVAGGFGTMSCGTGCVGTFEEEVSTTGGGAATLVVFEEDARDGSRVNVVEVPIRIVP